jgi:hypothetical protein
VAFREVLPYLSLEPFRRCWYTQFLVALKESALLHRKLLNEVTLTSPAFRFDNFGTDPAGAELGFAVRQVLKNSSRLGDNPEVFWYQLFDEPTQLTAVRLTFYEGFTVYAAADHRTLTGAA